MPESRNCSQERSDHARGSPAPVLIAMPCTESLVPGPVSRDPPGKKSGDQTRDTRRGAAANALSWFTCSPGAVASIDEIYWGRRGTFTPKRRLKCVLLCRAPEV